MSDYDRHAADRLDASHRQFRDGSRRGWRSFADLVGDRDPGAEPSANSGAARRKRQRAFRQPPVLAGIARQIGADK